MKKVAIIGKQQPLYIRERMKSMLEGRGFETDILYMPTRNTADFKNELEGYHAIISAGEEFPKETFEYLKDLELVSRFGVGTNEIDKVAATKEGIAVCNAAGSFSKCVAECALALMLNLIRDFVNCEKDFRKGDWSRFFEGRNARQLSGKTVGLIGFGDISQALAKMLGGFECRLLAYDPFMNEDAAKRLNVTYASMDLLRKESDIISLHLPLNNDTQEMIDKKFLDGLKENVILINTSRGKLINEQDVAEYLKSGKLSAYGADVFSKEPPAEDNPLLSAPRTMLLPHSGSNGIESVEYAGEFAARNVIDFFEGKDVKTILNKDYVKNKR